LKKIHLTGETCTYVLAKQLHTDMEEESVSEMWKGRAESNDIEAVTGGGGDLGRE